MLSTTLDNTTSASTETSTTNNSHSSTPSNSNLNQHNTLKPQVELDLFMRLHAYAYNPSVIYPNPYVDQSQLPPQSTPSDSLQIPIPIPQDQVSLSNDPEQPVFNSSFIDYTDPTFYDSTVNNQNTQLITTAAPSLSYPDHTQPAFYPPNLLKQHFDYFDGNLIKTGNSNNSQSLGFSSMDEKFQKRKNSLSKRPGFFEALEEENANIKRRVQVKIACIHCKKACKKCDNGRPCTRCLRLGLSDSCVDAPRKERKKGIKRGPYTRRFDENGKETFEYDDGQDFIEHSGISFNHASSYYDPSSVMYPSQ